MDIEEELSYLRREMAETRKALADLEARHREDVARTLAREENIQFRLGKLEQEVGSVIRLTEQHDRQLLQIEQTALKNHAVQMEKLEAVLEALGKRNTSPLQQVTAKEWAGIIVAILTLATVGTEVLRTILNKLP